MEPRKRRRSLQLHIFTKVRHFVQNNKKTSKRKKELFDYTQFLWPETLFNSQQLHPKTCYTPFENKQFSTKWKTRTKKMAGQKLKKQKRYKEEQIQMKSHSHLNTEDNNNKWKLLHISKFSNLEFFNNNFTSPENLNEWRHTTSFKRQGPTQQPLLLIFNTSSARILKIFRNFSNLQKEKTKKTQLSASINLRTRRIFPPKWQRKTEAQNLHGNERTDSSSK